MKLQFIIFFLGLITAVTAVVATFISASSYDLLLLISIAGGGISLICIIYLGYFSPSWILAEIIVGIFALYAITDSLFRCFAGIRILDLLD